MRFPYQFCGCFAAAVFLLCAATAPAATIVPTAVYDVSVSTGYCDGFNCSTTYNKQFQASVPTTLQVGCTADAGSPICGSASASTLPSVSAGATTQTDHVSQDAAGLAQIVYYYQVLCESCSPGTIVPMGAAGSAAVIFTPGSAHGTVTYGIIAGANVYGYNPLTSSDNVDIDSVSISQGLQVCEVTWSGFGACAGSSNAFGTRFEAKVGTVYQIDMTANASVRLDNQVIFPGALPPQLQVYVDPVISFAPSFDSTGYSLAFSSGIANESATAPEPATWLLLSTAALGWGLGRRLRSLLTSPGSSY